MPVFKTADGGVIVVGASAAATRIITPPPVPALATPSFASVTVTGSTVSYTLAADPAVSGGAAITRRVVALVPVDDYVGAEQNPVLWPNWLDAAQTVSAYVGGAQSNGATGSFTNVPVGTYRLTVQYRDTGFDPWVRSLWSVGTSVAVVATDTTPAVVTLGAPVPGATTVSVPWSVDEPGSAIYVVNTQSAAMTYAQIDAATGRKTASATVSGNQTDFAWDGLTASTSGLYLHVGFKNAANLETVVRSASFSTQAASGTLALVEYLADGVPFPSREHLNLRTAQAPYTVTGTNGTVVEAQEFIPSLNIPVTEWGVLGTISGGTLSATRTVPWWPEPLNRRVRAQANPGNVITATNKFEISESVYSVGQSEDAHIWNTSLSNTTKDALLSYKDALTASLTRHGRVGNYAPTKKRLGVDALPTGVTETAASATTGGFITIGASYDASVIFKDWLLVKPSGEAFGLVVNRDGVTVRNCLITLENHTGHAPAVGFKMEATVNNCSIEYCETRGRATITAAMMQYARMGAAFQQVQSGGGSTASIGQGCRFYRNKAVNMPDDGYKSGAAFLIENLYAAPSNIPLTLQDYSQTATYALGEAVRVAQGGGGYRYYTSLIASNTGNNTFPNASQSNTWWKSYDPHSDPINYFACIHPSLCAGNIVDLRQAPEYLPTSQHAAAPSVGKQSGMYITPNDSGTGANSPFKQLVVYGNIVRGFTGLVTSDPFDVSKSNSVSWVPPIFVGNHIEASGRSATNRKYFYIIVSGDCIVGENYDFATGAQIVDPLNATRTNYGIDFTPAKRVLHSTLNIAQGPNSSVIADIGTAANMVKVRVTGTGTGTGARETAALIKMTNALNAESALRRFVIAHSTWQGTDPRWVADDSMLARRSTNEVVIRDNTFYDGDPSILTSSWFAAPGSLKSAYGRALAPVFLGVKHDGTAYSNPHTYTGHGGTNDSMAMDFSWADIVDYAGVTRYAPRGPHKFISYGTPTPGAALDPSMLDKQMARLAWRETCAARSDRCLPPALEAINYRQGDDAAPSNGGPTHPNNRNEEGLEWKAALDAMAFAQSLGICRVPTPEFDQIAWAANGSYVEIWSSQGPITTTAIMRGNAALPSTYAHYTDVMGFRIGPDNDSTVISTGAGALCQNVSIVNGRVRIAPNTGSFANGNNIGFGNFGAAGDDGTNYPADHQNDIHRHMPVLNADAGPYGGPGLPLRPMPSISLVATGIA